jgi:hypothetical protein
MGALRRHMQENRMIYSNITRSCANSAQKHPILRPVRKEPLRRLMAEVLFSES